MYFKKSLILEGTERKKKFKKTLQVIFPLLLGAFILVWVYRDFNFQRVGEVLAHHMNYGWMALSLVFGILANLFRGWRWKLALKPLDEHPKTANCIYAIFISYASNLVIPRVGEVTRCGVLSKYDGVSFSKSLGTVVTERMIDSLCVGLITGLVLLSQMPVFAAFLYPIAKCFMVGYYEHNGIPSIVGCYTISKKITRDVDEIPS